jgi:hypothetical protein
MTPAGEQRRPVCGDTVLVKLVKTSSGSSGETLRPRLARFTPKTRPMHSDSTVVDNPDRLVLDDDIPWLTSADARQALDQLKGSPALAEGKVCLISLEAIRERMGGDRWPGRRDMVYDYVRQTLRRQFDPHDFFLRISDADYLVAQPGISRLAGQAYCLNCLREILTYFLGEALIADIVVHEVSAIGDGAVDAHRLDVAKVEAEEVAERIGRRSREARTALTSQDRWTPFVAQDGRALHASSRLEPVFQLKTFARIGYRMSRSVRQLPDEKQLSPAALRKLSSLDIEKIDFATLARGLNRLQQEGDAERLPSLILPVSFATLSSMRGRPVLAEFFRAAQTTVQRGLICEVCDIEGVPPGALLAATSLIKPFCVFVIGRLTTAPSAHLGPYRDAGLHGYSVECPAGLSDGEFGDFARTVMAATKSAAKAVMFFGVAGPKQAAFASLHGATHASFASLHPAPSVAMDAALVAD